MNRSVMHSSLLPMRTHKKVQQSPSGSFTGGLLWGMAFCCAGGFAAILLSALIAYLSPDPDALILPLGFGAMVLSCLLGGLGVGLKCDSALLPCSLLCGCIYIGLGLVLSLFFGSELRQALTLGLSLGAALGIRAGLVVLFCAGAVLTRQIRAKLHTPVRRRR